MGFFKRESKEDAIRKELGEDLQMLSEQIGALQGDLRGKNAELEELRAKATQAQQQDATEDQAHSRKKVEELTEQSKQREAALAAAQARLHELESQVAQASAGAQPPTAAAQPAEVAPQANEQPGQTVQPSGTPGLAVGSTAYVAQAGGLPLRLRSSPGLAPDSVVGKLPPGTQMTLLGGPEDKDGYTWWHIRTADSREGWVAGQDLRSQPE